MEAMQGTVKGIKGSTVKIRTLGKVTEVEEGRDAFDNIWMHKTINSWQVHLVNTMRLVKIIAHMSRYIPS